MWTYNENEENAKIGMQLQRANTL